MSKFSKKIVGAALTATTVTWMSGAMMLLPVAHAQSSADLQAQIAALLAQIQQLQAQLGASSASGAGTCTAAYAVDLTVGSKGASVSSLQAYLINKGFLAIAAPTGYFGNLTKAAVAKWQASVGISPTAGYFGPKSRAFLNSLCAGGTGTGTGSGSGGVVIPGTGLAASLAFNSPAGSAIAGAGQLDVAKFNLSASAGGSVNVTGLTFQKVGVVSDSNINNLYIADESGAVIAQYNSLSQGKATFSGLNVSVSAGGTRTLTLRMDLSSSATAGNTLGWRLDAVTSNSATVSGLPVSSNTLTVTTVSNPSLATYTWNFNNVGTPVDAGTSNVVIGTASVSVSNSPVWARSVKYTIVGSANMADIRNLKLMVNGLQVGNTVPMPNADGTVVFDLNANPSKLNSGNSTFDLYADITGSPNRSFTVHILRPYDLNFVDSQYNTGISPTTLTDDANTVTISNGSITISLSSDTPTGNIPISASNVTLAKFNIYAAGEPVKVKFLTLKLETSGSVGGAVVANWVDEVENIQIIDDAGGQVGNTISTITDNTVTGTCQEFATTSTKCLFGTSSSPINYIVPANTTRVLSVKVNVLSTADASNLRARLLAGSSNLEGQISFAAASSGEVAGALLAIASTPLTVAANGAFSNPTYVAGANNVKIASFVFTASSADGARITSLTLDKDLATDAINIQNVKVMVGSTQFGATRATVADGGTTIAFSGANPIMVPAGGSVTVDIFADILGDSTAVAHTSVIDYSSWTAIGVITQSPITAQAEAAGQNVTISSGPTLTVAADSTNPAARQLSMGATAQSVIAVRLTNDNVEDVKVTDLAVQDTIANNTAGRTTFKNVTLWDGSTQVGGPLTATIGGTTSSTVTFSFGTPFVVLKNSAKSLTVKADVASFTDGAISNSVHIFNVSSSAITALGKDSNAAAQVSGSAAGLAQAVYRTKLSFTGSLTGTASARTRAAVDDIANLSFTADSAFQVLLNSVTVRFNGSAISGTAAFTVDLLKSDNTPLGSAAQATCTPASSNSCSVTFTPAFTVSAGPGASQAAKLRINSINFTNVASQSDSLSILINGVNDVSWSDGTTAHVPLETSTVPYTLANTSYE